MPNKRTMAAVAKWVFQFIRLQLRCGYTLNEIEQSLYKEITSGDMYNFLKLSSDVYEETKYEGARR